MNPASSYTPGREIARGGMGAVLDARDQKLGRSVAMKVMLRRNASEEEQQRFLQEARVLGQLAHPNIVPVHDVGTDEQGRLFYTMKLVVGVTLHEVIGKLKAGDKETLAKYPLNALLTIFQKVCDAVAFAHSRGIIHRDLKPQNIMVGEFGEVLVMDWGLAKILPGSAAAEEAAKVVPLREQLGQTGPTGTLPLNSTTAEDQATLASTPAADEQATLASGTGSASAPKLQFGSQEPQPTASSGAYATMEGAVMGTPNYMSPEQAEGKIAELDARSDIFSLGGILYVLLTLRPPVEGDSVEEILSKVSSGIIAPPTDFNAPGSLAHGTTATTGGVTEPRKIHPLLHCPGGKVPAALSAVTMKALMRDKARRYQTVAEFTRDITAYQGGFATSAEDADLLTLALLFFRRNKVLATAAALVLLVILIALPLVIASERKATANATLAGQNEQEAKRNAATARANERLADANAKQARLAESRAGQEAEAARRALARSQVSLAEAAYREQDSRAMRAALDAVPVELRDGDWRYLDTRTDNSLAKLVHPAKALFGGVAGHPTQPGVFAVAGTDRTISFIEAATGRRVSSFPMSPRQQRTVFYRTLDFSPDGARLLVGALEAAAGVAIYDASTGKPLVEWDGSGVDLVRFNADGSRTLDLTVRGELSIREAANGRELWSAKQVRRAVFTPAGDLLAATANGLQLLNGTNGTLVKQFPAGRPDVVSMVLTRDGKTLLLGNADGSVRGLRMPEGTVAFERPFTEGRSSPRLALSGDGQRVAIAAALPGGLRIARWWETGSGQPVQSLFGSVGPMEALAVHPLSGEIIITGHDTRTWRFTTRPPQWQLAGSTRAAVFWGADDVFIPLGTPVKLGAWNQSSLLPVNLPPEASGAYHAAAGGEVAVLAKQLATPNPACVALVLRKTPAGFQFAHSFTCPGYLFQVRLSPDGQRLAVLDFYWTITLFDTTTGKQLPTCERAGLQNCWDFGWLDRDHLVGVGTKGAHGEADTEERVVLWDANTGRALRMVRHETALGRLAIAPGGRSFAEGGADKRIRIRDAKTLEVTREFRAHDGRISALAFHPTKPILATGSGDLTIRLWNLDDFSLREEMRPWPVEPVSLMFSPTGARLAGANGVGGVAIWDFTAPADPPTLPVARAHARAGRWAEARTALVEAVRLAPNDSLASMYLAVVLAQLGDRAAYHAHGHALLDVFKTAARPEELERAAKSALLLPIDGMAAADRDAAIQLAQKAVTVGATSGLHLYFQFTQALAQHRAGNHSPAAAALDQLSKCDNEMLAGTSLCVLAPAQHRLGRHAEARTTLARAEAFAAEKLPKPDAPDLGGAWNDVMIAHLLLREAREVMGKQ